MGDYEANLDRDVSARELFSESDGILSDWVLVGRFILPGGLTRYSATSSDNMDPIMGLGLTTAAKLSAEERFFNSDESEGG